MHCETERTQQMSVMKEATGKREGISWNGMESGKWKVGSEKQKVEGDWETGGRAEGRIIAYANVKERNRVSLFMVETDGRH